MQDIVLSAEASLFDIRFLVYMSAYLIYKVFHERHERQPSRIYMRENIRFHALLIR